VEGGKLRGVLRHLVEENFARGEDRQAIVSQHAQIQLPAFNVFLDQRIGVELLVDEPRALDRLLLVFGERRPADAVGSVLAHRLDERGIREASEPAQRVGAMRDYEMRQADVVVGQHLLGERLILAQQQSVGTRSGVPHLHQIQERGDVGLVGPIVIEGFGKVEDHVRAKRRELVHDPRHVVEHRQGFHFVAETPQGFEHIGFRRFVLLLERLRRKGFVRVCRTRYIEQHQDLHA
jgi:hypothetical protein